MKTVNPTPVLSTTILVMILTLLLTLLLAACGDVRTLPASGSTQADAEARSAVLLAIDEAFDASRTADDTELPGPNGSALGDGGSSSALQAQSVEPTVAIRRTGMHRTRTLQSLRIDLSTTPPTGIAEVALSVTGTAHLIEIYPDRSAPHRKVGEKRIDLTGHATLELERVNGAWQVVGLRHSGLSQGEYAAEIVSWSVDPDPLRPATDGNVASAVLAEPDTDDEFLVLARGHRLHPRGVLNDNGTAPDEVANDDHYNGYVTVGDDVRPGRHLAFISALNYSRTTDLSRAEDGGYRFPYTDTLQPVVVRVTDARDGVSDGVSDGADVEPFAANADRAE